MRLITAMGLGGTSACRQFLGSLACDIVAHPVTAFCGSLLGTDVNDRGSAQQGALLTAQALSDQTQPFLPQSFACSQLGLVQVEQKTGTNPTVIVLVVVCGGVAILIAVNFFLYFYARHTQGVKPVKKVIHPRCTLDPVAPGLAIAVPVVSS